MKGSGVASMLWCLFALFFAFWFSILLHISILALTSESESKALLLTFHFLFLASHILHLVWCLPSCAVFLVSCFLLLRFSFLFLRLTFVTIPLLIVIGSRHRTFLLNCQVVKPLGCQAVGLLGCWATSLPGCHAISIKRIVVPWGRQEIGTQCCSKLLNLKGRSRFITKPLAYRGVPRFCAPWSSIHGVGIRLWLNKKEKYGLKVSKMNSFERISKRENALFEAAGWPAGWSPPIPCPCPGPAATET